MASSSRPDCIHSFAEVLAVECSGSSTLVLSLKNEQLMLHTAQARTIKAMVEQFLSELKKASMGRPALPGLPGSRLEFRQGPWYSWVWLGGHLGQAADCPSVRRTLAMSLLCAATSLMTTASSASSVGTSSSYSQGSPRSQVAPRAGRGRPPRGRGGEVGEPSFCNAFQAGSLALLEAARDSFLPTWCSQLLLRTAPFPWDRETAGSARVNHGS